MAYTPRPADLEYVEVADQIGMCVSAGILDGIAHACLRAQVNDAIDVGSLKRGIQRVMVREIEFDETKIPLFPVERGDAVALELRRIIVVEVIDAEYALAPAEQGGADMIANEPRCSRNQYRHCPPAFDLLLR